MANRKKKLTRSELDRQIRAVQSLCKQTPGEKSVVQELVEERRAEKERKTVKARDVLVTRTLRRAGWRVLRVWKHELAKKNEARLLWRLQRALQ
jgi:very-short-patch-repair endonuclease